MKKLNNKILIAVLTLLVGIFAVSRAFRGSKRQTNLRKQLVALDTVAVSEIKIYPATLKGKELTIKKEGKGWVIKDDRRSAPVEQGSANTAMNYFIDLKPLQLISTRKDKWNEFSVGDSSTQVKFMNGSDVLANIRIGRVGFNQQPGQQQFSPGSIFTYVRLNDEDKVYSVEGFLESSFNRAFDEWRDKGFARIKKGIIKRIAFNYPSDSGFVLEKKDKVWNINNVVIDSTKVNAYLSQMEFKNATAFADSFTPSTKADAIIEFSDGATIFSTVEAWRNGSEWIFKSSHQDNVYFAMKGLESILERRRNFQPDPLK